MSPESPQVSAPPADAEGTAAAAPTDVSQQAAEPAEADSSVTVQPVAFSPLDAGAATAPGARSLDLLLDVRVPITVELGHTIMPIEDLLALQPGSVLELDRLASDPVDLLIRDHVIAQGEIIVVDDSFGLRITGIVDPAERVESLAPQPPESGEGGDQAPVAATDAEPSEGDEQEEKA